MCGIAGYVSSSKDGSRIDLLRGLANALRHRGPDDEGFFEEPGVGLAMRRLSIVDLECGKQPIANEDGTVHVVFNGEIYNYIELRADLEARGHRFATQGDTETLVHLYEEHGVGHAAVSSRDVCVRDLGFARETALSRARSTRQEAAELRPQSARPSTSVPSWRRCSIRSWRNGRSILTRWRPI